MWQVVHNNSLTWDNIHRRGFQDLGRCSLCKEYLEDVEHLFLTCPFVISVWSGVLQTLKIHVIQNMVSIQRCLTQWFEGFKRYCSSPFYILWGIWRSRNENIFEQTEPDTRDAYLNIFAYFMEIWLMKEEQPRIHFRLVEVWSYLFFYFLFFMEHPPTGFVEVGNIWF